MRGWLRDTAGGLPATYWYLWTGLLINRVGGFAILFLSLYLTVQRGASPALAGLIVGTYGIGGVLGTLLGGVVTDRRGRRYTLLRAHVAGAAVLVALALSAHLAVIAALCLLLGLAQAAPSPAFVAAIIDVVPAERRSRAFNLQFWAFNLGTAAASLLAGLLAEWSYVGLFLVDAGTTLTSALLLAWKVPETLAGAGSPRRAGERGGTGPGSGGTQAWGRRPATARPGAGPLPVVQHRPGGLRTVLTDRVFLVFVGLTLLQALVYSQNNTIVPLAMSADGLRPAAYGVLVAVSGALIVVGAVGAAAAALHLVAGPYRERRVATIRQETAETATVT